MNATSFKNKQTKKSQTTSPHQKPSQNQNNHLKQLFIQANFSFIFNFIPEIIIVQTLSIKVAIRNLHSHLTFQSIHFFNIKIGQIFNCSSQFNNPEKDWKILYNNIFT